MDAPLLVVESNISMKLVAERGLPDTRRLIGASTVREAIAIVRNERVAAALVDARLSDGSGFDVVIAALAMQCGLDSPSVSRARRSASHHAPRSIDLPPKQTSKLSRAN